jgi:hypothetical protein
VEIDDRVGWIGAGPLLSESSKKQTLSRPFAILFALLAHALWDWATKSTEADVCDLQSETRLGCWCD